MSTSPSPPNSSPTKPDPAAWLKQDVKDILPPERMFLETYAGIPPEEVVPHVVAIVTFAIHPWPCIGHLRFLHFTLANYPFYPRLLARLLTAPDNANDNDPKLLDVGSCFGQDLRKLIADGVSPSQIAGLDLDSAFHDLGYKLFRDDTPLGDRPALVYDFYPRDILDGRADWTPLVARFDVVHAANFLHIWDWDTQVRVACRLGSFLRRKAGGCIVGCSLGVKSGGREMNGYDGRGSCFRHDLESFERFWALVGERMGVLWRVEARVVPLELPKELQGVGWANDGMGSVEFEVTMQ
ncbi:hypothetical protein BO71DRAFT_421767 [Aspergillus ellipticus CBS 707.79]|uniref:Methyltransferase domain-containing protein n=1 Tax=Aspergillus ellipticus CBS 707.79 TaxID=1448320 RepID=A0A319D292_9EURO|nr:hypothetical protein BO71DRAFT_421767 [Aspergillus ellipticus CBS 707.79]